MGPQGVCGGGGGACVEHEHITVCTASRTDPGSHMQRCRYSACRDGAGWGRCTQELCWNGQMLEYVLGGGAGASAGPPGWACECACSEG